MGVYTCQRLGTLKIFRDVGGQGEELVYLEPMKYIPRVVHARDFGVERCVK